jgi:hypothetical protein
MLEVVCKEWFQLTANDQKHPRHDELRRTAERHITTSLAKDQWMMDDLSKYALSKSRLKRSISETDGGPYSDEQLLDKKQKRQQEVSVEGDDEQAQRFSQQNVTTPEDQLVDTQSTITTDVQLVITSTNPEPPSLTQQPDHLEHINNEGKLPNEEQPLAVTESLVQESPHASPEQSDLSPQPDAAIQMVEITEDVAQAVTADEIAHSKAETKEEEDLTGAPAVNDRGIDDLTLPLDDGATASGIQDTMVDELTRTAVDTAATDATLSKNTVTTADNTNGAIVTSSNNEDTTADTNFNEEDTGVITDLQGSAADLNDELDRAEAEELLQQDYKEELCLTPIGDGVSTPGSWGLVETENAATILDEDTKDEGDTVESIDTRNG